MTKKNVKLKYFIRDEKRNCINCHMSQSDCLCGEDSAEVLGYNYTFEPRRGWRKGKTFFITPEDMVKYHDIFGVDSL